MLLLFVSLYSLTSVLRNTGQFPSSQQQQTSRQADPLVTGRWELLMPKGGAVLGAATLGMQFVHNVLLPSGKVCILYL